jgi:hypothetical protein
LGAVTVLITTSVPFKESKTRDLSRPSSNRKSTRNRLPESSFVLVLVVHGKIPAMSFIIVVGIIARFLLKFNEREFRHIQFFGNQNMESFGQADGDVKATNARVRFDPGQCDRRAQRAR